MPLRGAFAAVTLALIWITALAHAEQAAKPRQSAASHTSAVSNQETSSMNIRLTIDGQVLSATLEDSAAARDFAALLPLTLDLEDYAATEKIAQLPKKLSTAGVPAGMTPTIGDITYYAPWGNLAIFYKDFGHSAGLVKLGRIEGDVQVLRGRGPLKAGIEAVGKD